MKVFLNVLLVIGVFSLTMIYSCGGSVSPSLSLQQKATKILDEGSSWGGAGNVEVLASPTGVNPAELDALQVEFRSSGSEDWAPTFFDASGADDFLSTNNATWIWTGSGTDVITLTEASVAELTSVDVTETEITFSFEINQKNGGGRIMGIEGSYTVRLQ